MTQNKKYSALKQWTIGSKAFFLHSTKLVMVDKGWLNTKTSQTPLTHYEGIVIKSNANQQLELYLVGKTCVESLALEMFDESEIIAEWRSLGAKTQLPLLIEHEDGSLIPAQKRLGKLVVAKITPRRRGFSTLNSRRPFAPMRRKGFAKVLAKAI
jgi:hypothetical protein